MAIADPKSYAKKDDAVDVKSLSIADLVEALRAATGNDDASMQRRAQFEAEAHERINKRENEVHPHISVYSYPEGDIAAAAAGKIKKLECETLWVGYPLEVEQLTPQEVDLLNELQPGDYMFERADGTRTAMAVEGRLDNAGRLSRKSVTFACRGDESKNLPSMVAHLRSALGKKSREAELEAEVAALRALVTVPA